MTPVYEGRLAEPPAPVDPGPMIGSQKRPAAKPDDDWAGDAPTVRQPERKQDVDWSKVRYPDAGDHQVSFRQRRRGK